MNNIDKKIIGNRIKNIRLEKGMTLEEFGRLLSTSKSNVSMWENGRYIPNPERLKTIAKLGDTTVTELTAVLDFEVTDVKIINSIQSVLERIVNGLNMDVEEVFINNSASGYIITFGDAYRKIIEEHSKQSNITVEEAIKEIITSKLNDMELLETLK